MEFTAGGPTEVDVTITASNSGDGTTTLTETVASGYGYSVGSPSAATMDIVNPVPIDVSVSTLSNTTRGGTPGEFQFSRTGDTTDALTANISWFGDATYCDSLPSTVTFPAGDSTTDVDLTALPENLVIGNEWEYVTVASGTGYTPIMMDASMTITDNPPVISVADTTDPIEGGTGALTFSRAGGDLTSALTATYTVWGTATSGTDYTALSGSLTFAAGSSTAVVSFLKQRHHHISVVRPRRL